MTNNTKNNALSLEGIQKHILKVEGLFYKTNKEGEILSYLKLNVASEGYDKHYEQRIRRKELNLLYVLDEALSQAEINTHRTIECLDALEEYISSPDFYRQLIFDGEKIKTKKYIDALLKALKKASAILKEAVTDKEYEACIKNLSYLNPPPKKDTLISKLNNIENVVVNIFS